MSVFLPFVGDASMGKSERLSELLIIFHVISYLVTGFEDLTYLKN
jgi:hypothetical protein